MLSATDGARKVPPDRVKLPSTSQSLFALEAFTVPVPDIVSPPVPQYRSISLLPAVIEPLDAIESGLYVLLSPITNLPVFTVKVPVIDNAVAAFAIKYTACVAYTVPGPPVLE